ncbi:ras-related protein Rab-19-like [Mesoplodon densirostris]|uniref:ras-related protein Rab-19-like n=1 Tax=Mesoplodon densirostris TaxID=48708 RepID=UPI0028DBD80A|nr:ras-related protein Rab-19-like [Mesoplodon densirostris]
MRHPQHHLSWADEEGTAVGLVKNAKLRKPSVTSDFSVKQKWEIYSDSKETQKEVDFQMKILVVDGELTALQHWDTAGQERQVLSIIL